MSKASQLLRQVAQLKCKGFCITSCGPILISPNEMKQVMKYASEKELPADPRPATRKKDLWTFVTDGHTFCPFLQFGRCVVYPMRPMICRTYGAVKHRPLEDPRTTTLTCPFGCTDEMDEPLTMEESDFLIDYAKTHNLEVIERRMQRVKV